MEWEFDSTSLPGWIAIYQESRWLLRTYCLRSDEAKGRDYESVILERLHRFEDKSKKSLS